MRYVKYRYLVRVYKVGKDSYLSCVCP